MFEKTFRLGNRRFFFNLSFGIKKYNGQKIQGVGNRTKDGLYCVFLEYDNITLQFVIDEVKRLQKTFELSDFAIIKSSENSYHCYCVDKVFYKEYKEILIKSTVDKHWKTFPIDKGTHNWLLRFSKKGETYPICEGIVPSIYHKKQKSTAHLVFLRAKFNIVMNDSFEDGIEELYCGEYEI